MSLLKKITGFIVVMAVFPAVFAATARPSVIATTGARMPTITTKLSNGTTVSSTGNTTTTQTDAECIDAYLDCMKAPDVCGASFEECTNNTLFYAKRPMCASTLMQCRTSAVNTMYGTGTLTALATKNSSDEYTYPTAGSILGQMIEAAHINNRYDTSTCVRRYTTCLKKDDVCGADFELCTSDREFLKQKLFCESTLARCQDLGKTELFGRTNTAAAPIKPGRLRDMIDEGYALAAVNAVATCYKVADQCILNACSQNPYKCKEGSDQEIVKIVESITMLDGSLISTTTSEQGIGAVNRNEVSAFIRNACQETIGGNKFCYAASSVGNGSMPTDSQLRNEENREEVYAGIMNGDDNGSGRWNASMKVKIDQLIENFNKKTTQRCQDTITQCAMRTCGDGVGSTCYSASFADVTNDNKGVNNSRNYDGIKYGCEAIVNNDTSCKYAAATFQSTTGALIFSDTSIFDKLFPPVEEANNVNYDPISAISVLNAKLATSYNQAALDKMKKQCETLASGCIKSMCGADFQNCYRNRTDVYSTLTNTGTDNFDKSMNKVGGVLDYTVVLGLCVNTVKDNPICEEHLQVEAARMKVNNTTASVWGSGDNRAASARDGWLGAGEYGATQFESDNYTEVDVDGNPLCTSSQAGCGSVTGICNTTFTVKVGESDQLCLFDTEIKISEQSYKISQTINTLFQNLLYDMEKEAQAKYNAKLTKQQNMCLNNSGIAAGVMGNKDQGGTFQWVKLRSSSKVPSTYAVDGLKSNQFVTSNELYGSFCRARITIQSDDKNIQDKIRSATGSNNNWSTAYFAVGDPFTCGSWIPGSVLEDISNEVAKEKSGTNSDGKLKTGQGWAVAGLSVLGTVGGGLGFEAWQKGGLGGLLGTNNTKKEKKVNTNAEACVTQARLAVNMLNTTVTATTTDAVLQTKFQPYATAAVSAARKLLNAKGLSSDTLDDDKTHIENYETAFNDYLASDATDDTNHPNKKATAKNAATALSSLCNRYKDTEMDLSGGQTAGRVITDIVGAGIGGTLLGVGGAQIMKASNRAKFTAEQEAWMNEVGKHIRCYLGSEELGEYGDMLSIELE